MLTPKSIWWSTELWISSPGHISLRRTTIKDQIIVAQMQVQADRALRYITCVDYANGCAGKKKLDRVKKALNDIITLLDDAQERLDTSKKNVEKGCIINDSIQATLWSLRETKGCSSHEIQPYLYSKSEDIAGTLQHEKHTSPQKVAMMEPLRWKEA